MRVGLWTPVGRERDGLPVGVPGDLSHAPVAARDLPRSAARCVDDEEMRPPIPVTLFIPAPVGPDDVASHRGLRIGAPRRATTGDRSRPAADESGRIDLGRKPESTSIRRPGDLADRPVPAEPGHPDPVGPADVEDRDRRDRVVVGRVAAHERERVAVRAEAGLGIADRAVCQPTRPRDRPVRREVDRVEVAEIPVAPDRPSNDDRRAPVGRQVEFLDDHDPTDVVGRHRSAGRHGRQPSRAATLRECPTRR